MDSSGDNSFLSTLFSRLLISSTDEYSSEFVKQIVPFFNDENKVMALQICGLLSKNVDNIQEIFNNSLDKSLIKFLVNADDISTSVLACRCLSNLCYENPVFQRQLVSNEDVLPSLKRIMNSIIEEKISSKVVQEEKAMLYCCGFLQNIVSEHDDIISTVLLAGIIPLLEKLMERHWSDPMICNLASFFLIRLCDDEDAATCISKTSLFDFLCKRVSLIEDESDLAELLYGIFHLLRLSESKDIERIYNDKFFDDVCKLACQSESEDLYKCACDVIVSLLYSRSCIARVIHSKGELLIPMLTNEHSVVRASGALALGNAVDCTANAEILLPLKSYLLEMLQDKDTILAALAALKNLSIPTSNKEILLGHLPKFIDLLLNPLEGSVNLEMKVVQLIRVLVASSSVQCSQLASNIPVVCRLVAISDRDFDHGAHEPRRLLAALITYGSLMKKNSSELDHSTIIKTVSRLLELPHSVTKSEVLIALNMAFGQQPSLKLTFDVDKFLKSAKEILNEEPNDHVLQQHSVISNLLVLLFVLWELKPVQAFISSNKEAIVSLKESSVAGNSASALLDRLECS